MIYVSQEDGPEPHSKAHYNLNFDNEPFMMEVLNTLKEEGGKTGLLIYQTFKSSIASKSNTIVDVTSSELLWLGTLLAICTKVNLHSYGEELCAKVMAIENGQRETIHRTNNS